MATSERNQLGVSSGSRQLSALEAQLPVSDKALYGFQPFGFLGNGNCFGMPAYEIINNLGAAFIATEVGTGTKAMGAATATLPPYVNLTTGTTQHDNLQLQWAAPTTAGSTTAAAFAPFICKANYNIHMFARVMITTTVANAAVLVGLATVDTTSLASSAISNDDFIGFYKAASATMGGVLRNGGTSTTQALTVDATSGWTPTVSTWYDLSMKIIGRSTAIFYVNGEATTTSTMTNLPANTEVLCPTIAVSAGTAAAATLHIQAFSAFQEAR